MRGDLSRDFSYFLRLLRQGYRENSWREELGMKGHTRKRGKGWSYVMDVGADVETGQRKQRWVSGFATEREADKALRAALKGIDDGVDVRPTRQTLADYLADPKKGWLAAVRGQLRPKTFDSYEW